MSNCAKYVTMTARLMRQLGIAEEVIAIGATFNPKAGTRAQDAEWLRGKMKEAQDAIHKIDVQGTKYMKT